MYVFLKRGFVFSFFLVLYFTINGIFNHYAYSTRNVELNKSRILIIGDSHTRKSLNPDLFDSAKNISQEAEPYVLSYWKIKKIFKKFKPDSLLIGFAPHNISGFNDFKFSDEAWSAEMFKRSYPIGNFKAIEDKVKVDYLSFYKIYWKQIGFYPKRNHNYFIGRYANSNFSNVSNWKKVIKRHYYLNNKELGTSELAISYLDSIIKICKENQVTPILVSSPLNKLYYRKIPVKALKNYNELKNKLILENIFVIDKSGEAYPDSLFYDSDHLNAKGAERFTKEIINLLGKNSKKQLN